MRRRLTQTRARRRALHHASGTTAITRAIPSAGMAGLVLGITILGSEPTSASTPSVPTRKIVLVMQTEPNRYGSVPAYDFALADGEDTLPVNKVSVPGPTLILRRGEPAELSLVNRLPEATAIHWHGMELESYYDGVHGWSGSAGRVTPLIEPGRSFTVRFTPPRCGTFIYHTHMHDDHQLTSGMYGALLVLEPGETYDPALDHVVVIARGGPGRDAPTILNGARAPHFTLKSGQAHRFRFINITSDDIFVVSVGTSDGPVSWRPLTKDGAPVPSDQSIAGPRSRSSPSVRPTTSNTRRRKGDGHFGWTSGRKRGTGRCRGGWTSSDRAVPVPSTSCLVPGARACYLVKRGLSLKASTLVRGRRRHLKNPANLGL